MLKLRVDTRLWDVGGDSMHTGCTCACVCVGRGGFDPAAAELGDSNVLPAECFRACRSILVSSVSLQIKPGSSLANPRIEVNYCCVACWSGFGLLRSARHSYIRSR